jgi:hypothetical protein
VSASGASVCASCPAGKYATSNATDEQGGLNSQVLSGAFFCNMCPSGYFTSQTRTIVCQACASGLSSVKGASVCSPCEPGKASVYSSACNDCSPGDYAPTRGSLQCLKCSSGRFSGIGADSCKFAAAGFYVKPNSNVSLCPGHSSCDGGLMLPRPKESFWVNRRSVDFAALMYRCPRATCKGAHSSSCWESDHYQKPTGSDGELCQTDKIQCLAGSSGPLCSGCEDGYTFDSSKGFCVKCGKLRESIQAMSMIPIILAAGVLVLVHRRKKLPKWAMHCLPIRFLKQCDVGMLKVMWSTYQLIGTIGWSLSVTFPTPFKGVIRIMMFLQLDFLSLDCIR